MKTQFKMVIYCSIAHNQMILTPNRTNQNPKIRLNYFSSKKIIKILEKKTQNFLKQNKEKNINYLLRYVKKSKLKYKKI